MVTYNTYNYLLSDIKKLKGVGLKTSNLFKKKKISTIFDLLWKLPKSYTDRSVSTKIENLKIGEIQTVTLVPYKYNFPRIRNLPNRVNCRDETGELDCIFFNSYEGYVKKILPLNIKITVSGKISKFKNRYQITNPKYVSRDASLIKYKHNNYSLTEGISEKIYNNIINQILKNLPKIEEWHNKKILERFNNISWKEAIVKLHSPENVGKFKSNFYERLAYDEILASFLVCSEIRRKIRKIKKQKKLFI